MAPCRLPSSSILNPVYSGTCAAGACLEHNYLQRLTKERYSSNFTFQDPVAKYNGIDAFANSLRVLRALFNIDFIVHSTVVTGDIEITTRY